MSQITFKQFYLNQILDFLWRQWSALGVAGGGRSEDMWLIDPEPTLIFSIHMARYEPRLFDEILDWLVINGRWIDGQRIRTLAKNESDDTRRLLSAVSSYASQEAPTYKRKWQSLAALHKVGPDTNETTLFLTKDGKEYPKPNKPSPIFLDYGFMRDVFVLRKITRPVNVGTKANLRFLLRSLVGIGGRSECLVYLLTHDAGHPVEMAREIGLTVKGVRDMIIDLTDSGLVLTRPKGKRKLEYYLNKKRWFEFITGQNMEEIKPPVWLNWIALYSALNGVWNVLNEVEKTDSSYMKSSKLREAMETITTEFSRSGLEHPPVPGPDVKPDKYEKEFQSFITRVLGA